MRMSQKVIMGTFSNFTYLGKASITMTDRDLNAIVNTNFLFFRT